VGTSGAALARRVIAGGAGEEQSRFDRLRAGIDVAKKM
jgi:hypothetical protein